MIKKLLVVPLFSLAFASIGQTSLSFYHLGNTTFQNARFNPAWMPEGKLFIGLPALSGIHVHANNKLSYSQVFSKKGDRVLLDVYRIIPKLQNQNMASIQANVNLFHVGIRLKNGAAVSLFANERIEADVLYPKELIEIVWEGNYPSQGNTIDLGDAGIRATHFREIGLGLSQQANERLTIGATLKYLVGFLDVSTPGNLQARIRTDGGFFEIKGEYSNGTFRKSGVNIYEGNVGDLDSHLVVNSNTGLALDIGAVYKYTPSISIAASLLDIGWINWKEDIDSRALNDTTFSYSGTDLRYVEDLEQDFIDSLINKFNTVTVTDPYSSWLPAKANVSFIYHSNYRTHIYATVRSRLIQRKFKMLYGVGVTRKFTPSFTGSVSLTKLPQQFLNVGASFAIKNGVVQYYMAADQLINFDVTKFKAIDFRFGINFILTDKGKEGKATRKSKFAGPKGVDTFSFLGKTIKSKRRDGIYSVIKKQRKRKVKTRNPAKKKKF